MHKNSLFGMIILTAASLVMIGCTYPTKATGGGQVVGYSSYPSDSASFGFNGNSCEGGVTGQFNFIDKSLRIDGGVKIHGQVTDAYICDDPYSDTCAPCASGDNMVEGTYRSTNPKFPGNGAFTACLVDGGEGNGTTDTAYIALYGGPFDGYSLGGTVSGNVQEHDCDDD